MLLKMTRYELEKATHELQQKLGKNFVRVVQIGVLTLVFLGLGLYLSAFFDFLSPINAAPIGMLFIGFGLGIGFGYDRVLQRIVKLQLVPNVSKNDSTKNST